MAIGRRRPTTHAQRAVRIGWRLTLLVVGGAASAVAAAALFNMSLKDFHLSGTQQGQVGTTSSRHRGVASSATPRPWEKSIFDLVRTASWGRQGVIRCSLPRCPSPTKMLPTSASACGVMSRSVSSPVTLLPRQIRSALDAQDRDSVSCSICPFDESIRSTSPASAPLRTSQSSPPYRRFPRHYANAMFVLDPSGTRRGPRADSNSTHRIIHSPFHESSDMCWNLSRRGERCGDAAAGRQLSVRRAGRAAAVGGFCRAVSSRSHLHRVEASANCEWRGRYGRALQVAMASRLSRRVRTAVCQSPAGARLGGAPLRPDLARHTFAECGDPGTRPDRGAHQGRR